MGKEIIGYFKGKLSKNTFINDMKDYSKDIVLEVKIVIINLNMIT